MGKAPGRYNLHLGATWRVPASAPASAENITEPQILAELDALIGPLGQRARGGERFGVLSFAPASAPVIDSAGDFEPEQRYFPAGAHRRRPADLGRPAGPPGGAGRGAGPPSMPGRWTP